MLAEAVAFFRALVLSRSRLQLENMVLRREPLGTDTSVDTLYICGAHATREAYPACGN